MHVDEHPFGMVMPERNFSSENYRYGFNGKEQDPEIKGEGAQYDYGFRIYDPRIGKFLSIDPLFKSYPWYTPYQFAGNKPVGAIDLDGLEEKWVIKSWITKRKPSLTTVSYITLGDQAVAEKNAIMAVMNELQLSELKNPQEPKLVIEHGTAGELTVAEQRAIIENTVSQYVIRTGWKITTTSSGLTTVDEEYLATFEFDYTLLGNKDAIDEIKASVNAASIIIQSADEAKEMGFNLPRGIKKFVRYSTSVSVADNSLQGNTLGIVEDLAKALYKKSLKMLASAVPSLTATTKVLRSNPVITTVSGVLTSSAPEYHFDEIKEQNSLRLQMKTIAALLFLFQKGNQPTIVKTGALRPAVDRDNTRVQINPPIHDLPPLQ